MPFLGPFPVSLPDACQGCVSGSPTPTRRRIDGLGNYELELHPRHCAGITLADAAIDSMIGFLYLENWSLRPVVPSCLLTPATTNHLEGTNVFNTVLPGHFVAADLLSNHPDIADVLIAHSGDIRDFLVDREAFEAVEVIDGLLDVDLMDELAA